MKFSETIQKLFQLSNLVSAMAALIITIVCYQIFLHGDWTPPSQKPLTVSLQDSSEPLLSWSDVESVAVARGTGAPTLHLTLTKDGARKLKEATARNIGKDLVVRFDKTTLAEPRIKAAISGGSFALPCQDAEQAKTILSAFLAHQPIAL